MITVAENSVAALTLRCRFTSSQKNYFSGKTKSLFFHLKAKHFRKNKNIFYCIPLLFILHGICGCLCLITSLRYLDFDNLDFAVLQHESTLTLTYVHNVRPDLRFERIVCSRPDWQMLSLAWKYPCTQFSVVRIVDKWGLVCVHTYVKIFCFYGYINMANFTHKTAFQYDKGLESLHLSRATL